MDAYTLIWLYRDTIADLALMALMLALILGDGLLAAGVVVMARQLGWL
jgi:hypothetical protein